MMGSLKVMPSRAILMGKCQDGLPFLMEIADPEIGAVLIGCDSGFGKTHQLQVMVDSALKAATPHELQVFILTHNPAEWDRLADNTQSRKYLGGVYAWYDPAAEEMIQSLTEIAETRRDRRIHGPAILFILDDIHYAENLSFEAQVNLHWLLAYGAQSDMWLVSTISSGMVPAYRYWVDLFRTRVIGKVTSPRNAAILSTRDDSKASKLSLGQLKVWRGADWLTYSLPLLGK
jgi:hypothetical protein